MEIYKPSDKELKAIEARNRDLSGPKQLGPDEARMLPRFRYAPRSTRPAWVERRVSQLTRESDR